MKQEQLKKLYKTFLENKRTKSNDLLILRLCIDKLLKESEA